MSSRTSRLFSSLVAALLAAACSELPLAPIPPAPPPPPVASVTVSPGTPSILVGTAVQLAAFTTDAQGNTLSGRAISWSSSAVATATVSATGLVTGVSVGGPVTITATSEGQLGTAQVLVTAPPLPGYSLSSSTALLSVAQGTTSTMSYPLTTVDLLRTSFTGNVTLSVDNLPTGVTVVFYPVNPTAGSSSRFWLDVAPNAVPGTYSNLLVRGVASGLDDRTAPLTLTITVAPFSITLSSSTLSIMQGAATPTTTVNVIRDNFTGPVDLNVGWDGEDHDVLPPGVTAAFAPSPATGNSAVLTLTVGAAATPGVYRLFVFGGASTGGFCCIPLTLTVTAAPPPASPGYTLSLSASTFSIAQSAWSPSTTVLLARSNFTGNVNLSVDNLPTGVSAFFQPMDPITGSPPAMHLFVAGSALPGTYTNLLVRGVANGLSDRTVPLTLTITKAPFILTLSSSTLSIAQGASTPTTTVNVVRHSFTGPVSLYADGYDDHLWWALPDGVTAAFSPNPATGDSSVLTLSVDAATVPGVYYVRVGGGTSTLWWEEMLTLNITAASP